MAALTRLTGDVQVAEDAVQEACAIAVARWPAGGVPANPRSWLIGVARHKAADWARRDIRRIQKEVRYVHERGDDDAPRDLLPAADDQLGLIFMCCHPALDPGVRVGLTLRSVCGLTTAEIAAGFLVPEPAMAKRLQRARQKIRQAEIPLRVPPPDALAGRLDAVLRVIYLVFTEGHMATSGPALVREPFCDTAIRLARALVQLLPGEPEPAGLLALLLLTDARRSARAGPGGELVLLEDQDRSLWDRARIAEGLALVEAALLGRRPGAYQLWAAIAACHAEAATAAATDWRQIAALYGELTRYEPTPVVEANRAVAVAMAEGPAAGLTILDVLRSHPQLARWPQLHIARAELLRRLDRHDEAIDAYRTALRLEPPQAGRVHIQRRISELAAR